MLKEQKVKKAISAYATEKRVLFWHKPQNKTGFRRPKFKKFGLKSDHTLRISLWDDD